MLQDIDSCDCNDYSKFTANTGLAKISVANPNLDGNGPIQSVITGAANGTIVKSIIIKAQSFVTTGMVRLYISDAGGDISLYREIPIPTYPDIPYTPIPTVTWPLLEIDFVDEIKLEAGFQLFASTQTANLFNIIAEGLNWAYRADPAPGCCSFVQETAVNGVKTASVANPNPAGGAPQVNVFNTPPSGNGSVIKSITVAALQSTHEGMVRFFISPDGGTTNYLWIEVVIPETIQSGFTPSFKQLLKEDFHLQAGYSIMATTQNPESFAITVQGESWSYPI